MKGLLGALLIFGAAAMYLKKVREDDKCKCYMVQDLLGALECIMTAIRWEKQPLPVGIAGEKDRKYIGKYFERIDSKLQSKEPLQQIWEDVFSGIQPEELRNILTSITLSGDLTSVLGQLALATEQINKFQEEKKKKQAESWKLRVALTLSTAGIIVILLL